MDDNPYVKLWKDQFTNACDEAAAGQLCDLFRMLHYAEVIWPSTEQTLDPEHLETSRALREHRAAELREVLMELLDDKDGHKLKSWFQLYCDNVAKFRARARKFACGKNVFHDNGLWQNDA